MKTTYELMAPTPHVVPGPEGSVRVSLVEPPVTVTTVLNRDAARALWRGLSRVLDEGDQVDEQWSLRELKRLAGLLKDSKADLNEYRAEMLDITDRYMALLESTLRSSVR